MKYWKAPTASPDKLDLRDGKVIGQRFGPNRYVVARSPQHHFISVLGSRGQQIQDYIQRGGRGVIPNVQGLRELITEPNAFIFRECYKPDVNKSE